MNIFIFIQDESLKEMKLREDIPELPVCQDVLHRNGDGFWEDREGVGARGDRADARLR